jgi:hypothetical protein
LKYTFRFREKFDEPNDDSLKCIEITSDKLLGTYSKAEDDALSAAFGGHGKKRLNRVFDAIGFVYPDYSYPLRKGKKRKIVASVATAVPKGKKMKVLTHRPRYIETAVVPEFGEGTSSTSEVEQAAPTDRSAEGSTVVLKVPTVRPTEAKDDSTEEPKVEKSENARNSEPTCRGKIAKSAKSSYRNSQGKEDGQRVRCCNGDHKGLEPAPTKKIAEAVKVQVETEAGPSVPIKTKAVASEDKAEQQTSDTGMIAGQDMMEKAKSPAPEAPAEDVDYIIVHASGKNYPKKKS